jgi:hypothetical protein
MAMNSSGPISLGGATTGQSINLEIGQPATSTVSLNDTIVRTLAGVATGQIVVPTDFYGKSLSSGYFQIITSPATPLGAGLGRVIGDPASNTYYFCHVTPNPAAPQPNLIGRSDDSGNILFATRYTPNAYRFNIDEIKMSNFNSNYLIAAVNAGNSPPPTVGNAQGCIFYYLDKTNGSVVSQGAKYNGPTNNLGYYGGTIYDLAGGGKFMSLGTPPGLNGGLVINSSFSLINYTRVDTRPTSPGTTRYTPGYTGLQNSPTSVNLVDAKPAPAGGGMIYFNMTDTGSVTSAKHFPSPTALWTGLISSNNNFRYSVMTNGIWKYDRSADSVVSSATTASPGFATGFVGMPEITDSSGNFSMIRNSPVGTYTLNFITSSLTNPSAYVCTSPTTPTAYFRPAFYMSGYLYIAIQFATNVIGILKIKEDGSNLGSGITASVGGYSITLTQNPSGLISFTPAGGYGSVGASVINTALGNTQPTTFSNSTPAGTVSSSKTPV